MKYKMALYIPGFLMIVEAAFMLPSLGMSFFCKEWEATTSFLTTILLLCIPGILLIIKKPTDRYIKAWEDFVTVAVSWIVMALFGSLPFYLSGAIPTLTDSIFESVSGFTTTGASILPNIEALPKSVLLWRSTTHWMGGMGVLVFILSIISISGGHSIHLMRAETPGPDPGKLMPRVKTTAKMLYIIYVFLTILQIVVFLIAGMPLFDSVATSFSTAATGGFSIRNESIAAYGNPCFEIVITVFMLLFGVNFHIFYFMIIKHFRAAFKSEELRWYLGIIIASTAMITINLAMNACQSFLEAFRFASFQVVSVITTTGFYTTNYDAWPQLSRTIIFFLMFCGACASSTAGGFKIARIILLFKGAKSGLYRIIHPKALNAVIVNGRQVDDRVVNGAFIFLTFYIAIQSLSVIAVSFDRFDFETTLTAVIACFNNVGPGLSLVGPVNNYSDFSVFSKIVLSVNMLFGRLEIYPILLIFIPLAVKSRKTW